MDSARHQFVVNLAAALFGGVWQSPSMLRRARRAVEGKCRWLKPLVDRVFTRFPTPPRDDHLIHFIESDEGWTRSPVAVKERFRLPVRMWPPTVPLTGTPLPLCTTTELADWLGLTPERLDWYTDRKGLNSRQRIEHLCHYTHRWIPKPGPNPAKKYRLLEAPKPGLKRIQRQILARILDLVPPHDAAHGFRTGRSILTNAAPHCGRAVVLRFDLSDFFHSVPIGRAFHLFRAVGYPKEVAECLAALCTVRLPADVWDTRPHPASDSSDYATGVRLRHRHLPQGAPTSPAVANLCAFGMDLRLSALAAELDATYTRYADDLTLSGGAELADSAHRVRGLVAKIAADEGLVLNVQKSKVLRRGMRQTIAGVVVNVRPNVPRGEYDRLKAVLTNCVRHGPASQNRNNETDFRAHLNGRVSFVAMVNPARGRKLWAIFDRIVWPPSPSASDPACPPPS